LPEKGKDTVSGKRGSDRRRQWIDVAVKIGGGHGRRVNYRGRTRGLMHGGVLLKKWHRKQGNSKQRATTLSMPMDMEKVCSLFRLQRGWEWFVQNRSTLSLAAHGHPRH